TPGLVRAVQHSVAPVVLSGANAPLLQVDLTAVGGPAAIGSLTIDILGTAPLSDIASLQLVDATGTPPAQRTPIGRPVTFTFPAETIAVGTTAAWTVSASVSGSSHGTLGASVAKY